MTAKTPLITVFLVASLKVFSQSDALDPRVGLEKYALDQRQEKIYLDVPKRFYAPTETIWFKGYTLEPTISQPIRSKVVYVELVNFEQKVLDSRQIEVKNGTFKGDIKLPKEIPSGSYQVRVYTNWMRNFGNWFYFKKNIWVVPDFQGKGRWDEKEQDVLINFFPEGGDLIEGITSIVAFKATNPQGNSVNVSGTIVNAKGVTVSAFSTRKHGMGELLFTPEAGEKYMAILDSSNSEYSLPVVKSSGVSLRVRNSINSDTIQVVVQTKGIDLAGGKLIGHVNGVLILESESVFSGSFSMLVPRNALGEGIVHLTFFNKENVPFAERLLFANVPSDVKLVASFDKESYKVRDQVKMKVQLPDSAVGDVSIGITPSIEKQFDSYASNIVNYFLLTSDLGGIIEDPEYYFQGTKQSFKDLDLLLRTHGWCRFKWEKLLNEQFMPVYIYESGITIRGQIVDFFKKDKPRKGTLSMTKFEGGFSQISGDTDETGLFTISGLDFQDTTNVSISAFGFRGKSDKKDKWVSILLLEEGKPDVAPFREIKPPDNVKSFEMKSEKLQEIIQAYNLDPDAVYLDEFVKSGTRIRNDSFDRPGNIYGTPTRRIVTDSIGWAQSAQSVFDLLRAVSGVQVGGSFPNQSVQIRGQTTISAGAGPLYMLNGVPVDNITLGTVPVQDIDFVDVLKGSDATIYGSRGAGGVIAVYTKTGENRSIKEQEGIYSFAHPGYAQAREFFSPDYSKNLQGHIVPDYRSLLYWNPDVTLDDDKKELTFYTSDQRGVFHVRIEGLTNEGKPIFYTTDFVVE